MRDNDSEQGFRTRVDWMGDSVVTLDDIWPERARAMIVGLNPAPASVEVGHFYQGRSGQRQLLRLADAGLFQRPEAGSTYFETIAVNAGVGFTDVVKRPTRGEKDVRPEELEFGREALVAELTAHGVPLVICVFRQPVKVLLGRSGTPGFQSLSTGWGGRVFRLPGPFAAVAEVRAVMAELSQTLSTG